MDEMVVSIEQKPVGNPAVKFEISGITVNFSDVLDYAVIEVNYYDVDDKLVLREHIPVTKEELDEKWGADDSILATIALEKLQVSIKQ